MKIVSTLLLLILNRYSRNEKTSNPESLASSSLNLAYEMPKRDCAVFSNLHQNNELNSHYYTRS